jgi:thiol-disulfide isomerase/thioredoxin
MKKQVFIIAAVCWSVFSFGQSGMSWPGMASNFTMEKMNQPFLKVDSGFRTLAGKSFNFLKPGTNTFVYFGMYGCIPCMQELPSVVSVSRLHPELQFVYASYNEEGMIRHEFERLLGKGYRLPANFHIVMMSQLFIALQNLTICYPVKYFLDRQGVVRYLQYQDMSTFNGTEYEDFFSTNQAVIAAFNR